MALAARSAVIRSCASCRPTTARRSVVVVRAETGKEWMLSQPGICAPTGFFDPVGFTSSPEFSVTEAKRFREVELTHGRVAMLAALGWVVQEKFHPLFGGNIGGPAFNHFQRVDQVFPPFWKIILAAIGAAELYRLRRGYNLPTENKDQLKIEYMPGNLGFDPLGLYPSEPSTAFDIRTKEINNGRLAMIAIAGFAAQEEVNHQTIWKGLTQDNVIANNVVQSNTLQ